jgi:hypothetical protein
MGFYVGAVASHGPAVYTQLTTQHFGQNIIIYIGYNSCKKYKIYIFGITILNWLHNFVLRLRLLMWGSCVSWVKVGKCKSTNLNRLIMVASNACYGVPTCHVAKNSIACRAQHPFASSKFLHMSMKEFFPLVESARKLHVGLRSSTCEWFFLWTISTTISRVDSRGRKI